MCGDFALGSQHWCMFCSCCRLFGLGEQGQSCCLVKSGAVRRFAPVLDQIGAVYLFLRRAGIECGNLLFRCGCGFAGLPALRKARLDLGCAFAECPDSVCGNALDLEQRLFAYFNLVTQTTDVCGSSCRYTAPMVFCS